MTEQSLTDLDIVKRSRELLDKTYIKWVTDDGNGGHCALGAVQTTIWAARYASYASCGYPIAWTLLGNMARHLHPELAGAEAPRRGNAISCGFDYFNRQPMIYVNNQLGKQATLQVFDATILALEIELALAVPETLAVPEIAAPVEEAEPELALA